MAQRKVEFLVVKQHLELLENKNQFLINVIIDIICWLVDLKKMVNK